MNVMSRPGPAGNRSGDPAISTTTKDLIDRITQAAGANRTLVEAVVQHLFDVIIHALAHGNRVEFRVFGVFETMTTPARTAQNPRTSQKVPVPAKRRVVFRPGRLVRQRLNSHAPP